MTIQRRNPQTLSQPPHYTQIVGVKDRTIYFCAGQVAYDAQGNLVGGDDFRAQATQVFTNIQHILDDLGASWTDVMKITTYIVNYRAEHRAALIEVVRSFVGDGPPPASTLLGVQSLALPELLIEVDAIVAV